MSGSEKGDAALHGCRAVVWTFSADANGVHSYQPVAISQEKHQAKTSMSANGACHKDAKLYRRLETRT